MSDGQVTRQVLDGVATLTLVRPPRNALTAALADRLVAALRACGADPAVRAVVLTGGGATFSAGADLTDGPSSLRRLVAADGGAEPGYREPAGRVSAAIAALDVPVVAAVNGDAIGGGATITLAADLRFAADSARFGFPFTRLGVCPEGASTYHLPRLVGPGVTADWLLSGRLVDAAEALRCGLVSRLLPAADVLSAAQQWAAQVATRTSPAAVARTRRLLAAAPTSAAAASAAESAALVDLVGQPDCPEGIAAFLDRRPPRFEPRPTAVPPQGRGSQR
jgi:enoyl-CoA hydratase/carnithine racemase